MTASEGDTRNLSRRSWGDVFDEEVALHRHGLDQPGPVSVDGQQVDPVVPQRGPVVGRHRRGLAAEHRHPARIGAAGEVAQGGSIVRRRAPEGEGRVQRRSSTGPFMPGQSE